MPLDAPTFAAIVHDGVLREQGMPAFPELGTVDLEAIRHYIRQQAEGAESLTHAHGP